MLDLWPSLQLEGWEIDEILIEKSREYLGLSDLEKRTVAGGILNVHIGDALSQSVNASGGFADCEQSNIKTKHAFTGLRVTIDCKPENGHLKTRGVGKLDEEGKFKMSIHRKIVKDGKLNDECYAQLHSALAAPCPAHNGLESSKVVL
ncbi:proline-rich protein 4-like isoform X1 [Quercus lobata]|uniref:proline-rich protein 4-like isoform X1 n=1 Tax=Quercus lobata TaxID=97700 RepID=UPI00124916BD|nr:proline-rich protein 4-like isoform X1 [Quercus lobata]XP_030966662.1 proline-rich protein 4-like isoform X1 [Quercus lobata]XP_030966663.1 proline-rich protein 4-like isoform X1 [Quercus lobata]